jgi:hypothetical protein
VALNFNATKTISAIVAKSVEIEDAFKAVIINNALLVKLVEMVNAKVLLFYNKINAQLIMIAK